MEELEEMTDDGLDSRLDTIHTRMNELRAYEVEILTEQLCRAILKQRPDAKRADFGADTWENGYFFDDCDVLIDGKQDDEFSIEGDLLSTTTNAFAPIGWGAHLAVDLIARTMEVI